MTPWRRPPASTGEAASAQAQALGAREGAGRIAAGQHEQELLATPAHGGLAGHDAVAHDAGDGAQHGVAGGVAVVIVDRLEVVDVGHDDRERLARGGGGARLGQHGGSVTTADHAREHVGAGHALELQVALAQLVAQPAGAQRRADAGDELGRLDGLADVVVGAATEALGQLAGGGAPGDEDHRDRSRGLVGLHRVEHGEAVEPRHVAVQEDHVGDGVADARERLLAVLGLQHVVAGGDQVVAHHRAHESRVVGHEHAGGGLPVPAGQGGVDRGRQLLLGGALGEHGVDVQAVARGGDRVGRAGADEDEGKRDGGRVLADGAQQRQAVHRRHVDVADDDVHGGGVEHVEGVGAVAGAAHLEAGAAQEIGVDAKGHRAVVDQQHGGARTRAPRAAPARRPTASAARPAAPGRAG